MKLTVQSSALAKELSLISSAAGKSNLLPALQSIRLEAEGGVLSITATDLQVAMHSRVAVAMDRPGSVCLPAKRLNDFLRCLPDSSLTLAVSDNLRASIACNGTRAIIPGIAKAEFPEVPLSPSTPLFKAKAGPLAVSIKRTIFAIADPGQGNGLNASPFCQLEIEDGFVSLAGLKGHCFAYCETDAQTGEGTKPYLVGEACLREVMRACEASPDADLEFSVNESFTYFDVGGVLICGRNGAGSFPKYKHALPKSFQGQCEVNRQDLLRAVRTVAPFAQDRDTSKIVIEVSDGKLSLSGSSYESGECDDSIPALTDGSLKMSINARYVQEVLSSYVEDKVLIRFHDHKSALHLSPVSEGPRACFHMVMPMWD